MSTSATTFLPARNFTPETPLITQPASQVSFGTHHRLTTADNKNLVLTFKDCQVKCCVDKKNRPFLIASPEVNEELLTTLNSIRSRLVQETGIDEAQMRPILSAGQGLMKKKLSLFLNMTPNASLKDLQKQPVDYPTLVGKLCKLHLFIHLQSVFKNDEDNLSRVQFKVSHMLLAEAPTQEVVEVEQVQLEEPEDIEAML